MQHSLVYMKRHLMRERYVTRLSPSQCALGFPWLVYLERAHGAPWSTHGVLCQVNRLSYPSVGLRVQDEAAISKRKLVGPGNPPPKAQPFCHYNSDLPFLGFHVTGIPQHLLFLLSSFTQRAADLCVSLISTSPSC